MTDYTPYKSPALLPTEQDQVAAILAELDWDEARADRVKARTIEYIKTIRNAPSGMSEVETFLQNYPLSSPEGRALMTLVRSLAPRA